MAKDKKKYKKTGTKVEKQGVLHPGLWVRRFGAILGGTLVTVAAIGAVIVASKLSKINTVS